MSQAVVIARPVSERIWPRSEQRQLVEVCKSQYIATQQDLPHCLCSFRAARLVSQFDGLLACFRPPAIAAKVYHMQLV